MRFEEGEGIDVLDKENIAQCPQGRTRCGVFEEQQDGQYGWRLISRERVKVDSKR